MTLANPTPVATPAGGRTANTRALIIRSAEILFAERGVASVSLNEITRASGQKNRNAVHYHFGNKEALVQAIFDKHADDIVRQRSEHLAALQRADSFILEEVIAALVLPVAARFDDPDGGSAYIKISAQLAANNMLSYFHMDGPIHLSSSRWHDLGPLIATCVDTLPQAVQDQRTILMVGMMFHGLADHALIREQYPDSALANTALTVNILIDSICAMLRGPVSDATRAAL